MKFKHRWQTYQKSLTDSGERMWVGHPRVTAKRDRRGIVTVTVPTPTFAHCIRRRFAVCIEMALLRSGVFVREVQIVVNPAFRGHDYGMTAAECDSHMFRIEMESHGILDCGEYLVSVPKAAS